jgi:hypothetical protein
VEFILFKYFFPFLCWKSFLFLTKLWEQVAQVAVLKLIIFLSQILWSNISTVVLENRRNYKLIWCGNTIFILVCKIVGSVFGSIRFLLPVCRLGFYTRWTYMLGYHKWALAHSSSCLTLLHLKIYFFRFVANLVQNNITLFCGYTMHLFFSSVYYTIVIYMATKIFSFSN